MDNFYTLSTLILEELADFFETLWPSTDVDLLEDVLTVTLADQQQYVIHKHGITHQIWVSSPFTGAHHFYYKGGKWLCTRTGSRLQDLLMTERNTYAT